ncbi:morphogenic membrane protein MmpA [Streptomyces fagopyri]|uniref:morphogenic membrane protein MmpA n=1 Tax=Streptomyces fagopyri TaxID=2662397 RepID=UPI00381AD94A
MPTHRSPKPAARRARPGPAQPVERAVTAALVLSVVAGVGWVGGMIYTVLEWPL